MSVAGTVLAGAIGGLLAAFVTVIGLILTTRWKIAEENIIKERARWRDAVRSLIEQAVVETDSSKLRGIATGLALRMNPAEDSNKDDRELVALVYSLEDRENRTEAARARIVALAAHILKHDWSRAKWEADLWFTQREPVQTKYSGPASYQVPKSASPQ
ncbi:MAG TPA: hypothetical protein VM657_04480 [Sphingomonas sp.]|nr:hypothetical protein [Sphingomonas sp.]